MLVAVGDDVLCDGGIDARDAVQECGRGRVEVDADMVDRVLNRGVKRLLELLLADVVLVLTDADGLRVDFHEFGHRVLHAACDGDGTADCHVVIGQFFFCECGGGVDGGARLVRNEVMDVRPMIVADERGGELLRLVGCRAVADGDERYIMRLDEFQQRIGGSAAGVFALRYLNDAACKDVSRRVDDGDLAAGAVAGVEPHDDMPRKGGWSSSCRRLCPNTLIAFASASSVRRVRSSRSSAGTRRRL